LNDSHEIGEETKRIVQSYASKVNYRPNLIAQSLKEMNTRYIAIIVPEISNSFFAEIVNGVEFVANNQGYHVVIYQTHDSTEREINIIRDVARRKADGLLLSPSTNQTEVNEVMKSIGAKLPVVYFDRVPSDNYCHKVVCDNYQAAFEATSWLIQQGKRRIAHMAGPSGISISIERLAGYSAALLHAGISVDPNLIRYSNFLAREAWDNLRDLEELLGVKTMNPYGTLNQEIFAEKLESMTLTDLQNLSIKIGIPPTRNSIELKKNLKRSLEIYIRQHNIGSSVSGRPIIDPSSPNYESVVRLFKEGI
jgi:DNA-binding LacI/PurR family transcriptional regulator